MTTTATTGVRERPILFSAPMIRAILAGTKSQTRRIVKAPPWWRGMIHHATGTVDENGLTMTNMVLCEKTAKHWQYCPYGVPTSRLWVRECFWEPPDVTPKMLREGADTWPELIYDADATDQDWLREHGWRKRPSIHMRRRQSRITLELTEVRVQRVGEISHPDIAAEGILDYWDPEFSRTPYNYGRDKQLFAQLWDSINGRRPGCDWESDPFVWALSFQRITP